MITSTLANLKPGDRVKLHADTAEIISVWPADWVKGDGPMVNVHWRVTSGPSTGQTGYQIAEADREVELANLHDIQTTKGDTE